jgi:hypothetical protein
MSTDWPKHEDGTNKSIDEMTPDETRAVFLRIAERFAERGDTAGEAWFRRRAGERPA